MNLAPRYDCDDFTRGYYESYYGLPDADSRPLPVAQTLPAPVVVVRPPFPHTPLTPPQHTADPAPQYFWQRKGLLLQCKETSAEKTPG